MVTTVKLASLKNSALLALLVVACAFVLVGCGGSSSSSKDHSSEWTEEKVAAFYAKAEKSVITAGQSEELAKSPVIKELGECVLEQYKPLFSPDEVLGETGSEPKKAEEISKECQEKFKTPLAEEEKKLAAGSSSTESSGSTGATEGETGATESESTGATGTTEEAEKTTGG